MKAKLKGYFEAVRAVYEEHGAESEYDFRLSKPATEAALAKLSKRIGGDFDRTPLGTGKPGQIIAYSHDPDEIYFVADALADLLPISLASIEEDPLEFLCVF